MKNIPGKLFILLIIFTTLSGCSTIKESRGYVPDEKMVNAIRPEIDTKQTVETMLGNPTMKPTFDDANWYYYSKKTERWAFFKEKVTEMDILAITFDDDDYVSNIKHYTVKDNKIIDPVTKKTATLGRNDNFFAELFGNIGRFGSAGGGPEAGN